MLYNIHQIQLGIIVISAVVGTIALIFVCYMLSLLGKKQVIKRANRKLVRKQEALKRQAETAKLTPLDRLKKLDEKFGKYKGAEKERKRLAALLKDSEYKKYLRVS